MHDQAPLFQNVKVCSEEQTRMACMCQGQPHTIQFNFGWSRDGMRTNFFCIWIDTVSAHPLLLKQYSPFLSIMFAKRERSNRLLHLISRDDN
jgi:hypothetical protein